MVVSGFISRESALIDLKPSPIPTGAGKDLLMSDPQVSLGCGSGLDWSAAPRYYMFKRRIQSWVDCLQLRDTLNAAERR